MNASGGASLDADAGEMFGVAQRRFVLAQPGEACTRSCGLEGEALAQDASVTGFHAIVARVQDLLEGEQIGAGEKGRRMNAARSAMEPRPARQRPDF